ncbi:MAG: endonuclease/exonuclease/phosphatase family protein [Clostridia bacterium]|nr:endonuclease/exonuclease/phosphatase family protein [Clostridia bacterium]
MKKLRLMSTNQWACDKNQPWWEEHGLDCSYSARMSGFLKYYLETKPDILGLQEVTAKMADKLMRLFSEEGLPYALLWGRDTPIIYRTDLFELVDSTFLVYPEEFPGHEGSFNNSMTKSYNLGVFRIKESGKLLILMTTHLWWMRGTGDPNARNARNFRPFSDEARAYQIGLAIDCLDKYQAKYNCPAVIMGDMNDARTKPCVQTALARGFTHAYDVAVEHRDEGNGHHPCGVAGYQPYCPRAAADAIDHILVRGFEQDAVRAYDRYAPDYYMPLSDHIPVWIDVEI